MEEQGSSCLPRVVRSLKGIDSLRGEGESLSELVEQLYTRVTHLEVESSRSLQTLSELEVIKRRMDDCSSIFLQADRFRMLVRNMDPIYESGDVTRMSEALAELVSSYSHLSSLSEFEGDKALVSRYTEKLESIVKPALTEAIEKHNTQQAIACIKTFQQINRAEQISIVFQKYFNQKVLQLWQSFDSSSSSTFVSPLHTSSGATTTTSTGGGSSASSSRPSSPAMVPNVAAGGVSSPSSSTPSNPIHSWIYMFFERLAPMIQHEVSWIPSAFSEPATLIAKLLISSLTQLLTMFDLQLRKLGIAQLVEVYVATKTFATGIDHLIVPLGTGLRFQIYSSLFAPFRKYQSQFNSLEGKWISTQLTAAGETSGRKNDPSGLISTISLHARTLFSTLETSIDHCIRFTDASEAESLEKLMTGQLLLCMNFASQKLQSLQPLLTSPSPSSSNIPSTSPFLATGDGPNVAIPISPPTPTIPTSNDWREDLFTHAVETLKIAVEMKNAMASLVQSFRSKLLSQKQVLFGESPLKPIYQQNAAVVPNLFLYQTPETVRSLARLLDQLDDPLYNPFEATTTMIDAFTSTVQYIMFETMFGFVRHQMSGFTKLANFAHETGHPFPAPQTYMKQIVEHFLVLPQVMEHIESEAEAQGQDQLTFLNLPARPFSVHSRPKYSNLSSSVLQASDLEAECEQIGFSVDWMVLVSKETQFLLASLILQLPQLSSFGVQQLESDVSHLFSVLSVLELKQEPVLEQVLQYCRVPASDFAALLIDTVDAEHKKMLILIGRSRRVLPTAQPK